MSYFTIGHRLPRFLTAPLFGDRDKYGTVVRDEDDCWQEWQKTYIDFYVSNQKQSIGAVVNNAGYRIMSRVNLEGQRVLEIGPGDVGHLNHWRGKPSEYVLADISEEMLHRSAERLKAAEIPYSCQLCSRVNAGRLPFDDREFDVVVSFYTFEHLLGFGKHLAEMSRVLRSGGRIVGAIPSEGGLGWGLGRFLTSRRWLKRHTSINPDKIICWEHPNFAEEVLKTLDKVLQRQCVRYWPLRMPVLDLNLVISFVYQKP